MQTIYDIQQLLKKYGIYVYTGERYGDIVLLEMELDELWRSSMIQKEDYHLAKLIIRRELNYEKNKTL
ncbi:MAG TPA: YqgQ family protein [Candidatus Avamphibacillus intestinigallinarum]|nr:YqgQ family protein [Candidatus Avamphibacillus intestinigallinarum]